MAEVMTPTALFEALAPFVAPALDAEFGRLDLCILATRVVLDVAAYFGVEARPLPVRVVLFNAAFAAHVDEGDYDVRKWEPVDGSWSVGVGFGGAGDFDPAFKWAGHLVAAADGVFGDFSIQQAERLERGIVTGPALVGPLPASGVYWSATNSEGTVVEYNRVDDLAYRRAPDWRDEKRRRRIVGALIRQLRRNSVPAGNSESRG